MKVLVLDDELNIRELCQRGLTGEFEVTTAESGEEAKRLLASRAFDVVLADIHMDPPGGLQVAKHIRQVYPKTDVMMLTGYPSMDSVIEALKWGACDYITKPLDLLLLKASLRRCGRRRALQAGISRADQDLTELATAIEAAAASLEPLHRGLSPEEFDGKLLAFRARFKGLLEAAAAARQRLREAAAA